MKVVWSFFIVAANDEVSFQLAVVEQVVGLKGITTRVSASSKTYSILSNQKKQKILLYPSRVLNSAKGRVTNVLIRLD